MWSRHLQTFFDHFYQNCDVVKRDWLDLLSLLEQEVVYRIGLELNLYNKGRIVYVGKTIEFG